MSAKREVQRSLLTLCMAEAVEMPGFPQLIVSRGWLYHYLRSQGWSESERGYGSLDYTVFARTKVAAPLTITQERDYWLAQVGGAYDRGAV